MEYPTGFHGCTSLGSFSSILVLSLQLFIHPVSASTIFMLNSGCTCPGYNVTFTCIIPGGGNTIWKGSAFDCPSTSDSNNNQILLLHSRFGTDRNPTGFCNNGSIQGGGVSAVGGRFTSQLNVTITPSVVGKEVQCVHDNTSAEILIGKDSITVTTGNDLIAPGNVSLIAASPNQLTFNWTAVAHSCSAVNYTFTSSNCGDCPTTVSDSMATCEMEAIQPSDVRNCTASVRAVVCGDIQGVQSTTTTFRLKVPDVPEVVDVVPTYTQVDATLQTLSITFMEMQQNSDDITGSPLSYIIHYRNHASDTVCKMSTVVPLSCNKGVCNNMIDVKGSRCSSADTISVSVFATSYLGNGSASNLTFIDGENNFVEVEYKSSERRFICSFLNRPENDRAPLSCAISYNYIDGTADGSVMLKGNATNDPTRLRIDLDDDELDGEYLYTITASDGIRTVAVEGVFAIGRGSDNVILGATLGVLLPLVIFLIVFLVSVIYILYKKRKKVVHVNEGGEVGYLIELDAIVQDLELIKDSERYKLEQVDKKYRDLTAFLNYRKWKLIPGCVYYEFYRKEEKIPLDRDIIFQDKRSNKLFRSTVGRQLFEGPNDIIQRPNYVNHRVFVQSKGIGNRPLAKDTWILYDKEFEETDASPGSTELIPVDKNRFRHLRVHKDCALLEFIEEIENLEFQPGCAFFEFTHAEEDIDDKEVVLMSKSEEDVIFGGDGALTMIGAPGRNIKKPNLPKWKVFVQSKYFGSRHLPAGSMVLYEAPKTNDVPRIQESLVRKLTVHKCCQMKDYIANHGHTLEDNDKRFYFEFTNKAEFISQDRHVIVMNQDGEFLTGPKAKEMIGAPTAGTTQRVNNPQLEHYRVFISHAGSGTRCLKPKSIVLVEDLSSQDNKQE